MAEDVWTTLFADLETNQARLSEELPVDEALAELRQQHIRMIQALLGG